MPLPCYLAMTAAEIEQTAELPPKVAWMACHFSQANNGLTNLPTKLPPDNLIILDDSIPICRHDLYIILEQLNALCLNQNPKAILLDFQRPKNQEYVKLINLLETELSCPIIVTEIYQSDTDCPILLPPIPLDTPIDEYLAPWKGRQVWLEAALESMIFTITENGSTWEHLTCISHKGPNLTSTELHCHYQIEIAGKEIVIKLYRTIKDLSNLIMAAEAFEICGTIGLYQELWPQFQKRESDFSDSL